MPYATNITQKCQKAAKAFLDGEELSFISDEETQIKTGIAASELELPLVVCQCQVATHATPYEGNWQATLRIEVRTNAYDASGNSTEDDHHEFAGEVFSKFMDSPVNARQHLSNEELEFTCQNLVPLQQGWEIDDHSFVSYLILQIDCAGTYFDVT